MVISYLLCFSILVFILFYSFLYYILTKLILALKPGIAKVLVGQIVEESLEVQDSLKETGPIHPKHIRDAVRRLRNKGKLGISHHRKSKLKRL